MHSLNEEDYNQVKAWMAYLEYEKTNPMQRSEEEGKAYVYDFEDPDFNEKAFLKDLRADIALIERLQKEMKALKLVESDPKDEGASRVIPVPEAP